MTIVPTARNSDCQFWSVCSQKSAWLTNEPQETVASSCSRCSSLKKRHAVTDWANHDPTKSSAITSRSEFSYTSVRRPPTFAQRGASPGAYPRTCCFWSDSRPASSSRLDSFEPFWTSQTVARMKVVNWRNSDCQFSITAWPNADDVT